MPVISVVIPLYNKVSYVKRAIDSVLRQSCQDFEVIVVNDGSTDGSEKVVEEYRDERIKLLQREIPSPGGHAARNLGIKNATSDFIAFLDADDEWKTEFLETVLRLRERYSSAGAYATAYEEKDEERVKIPKFWFAPEEGIIPDYFKSCVYGGSPVWTGAVAIPKYIFEDVGYFPEEVKKGGDLDMWARIALKYPIAFSRYIGATYYKDIAGSVTKTHTVIEGYRVVSTLEEFLKNNRDISPEKKRYIKEYINKLRLKCVKACIQKGEFEKGLVHLKKCHTKKFIKKKAGLYLKIFFLSIRRRK